MSEPIDIRLIKGRQRTEDMRGLAAGEVTPEELQRENSFIWSASRLLVPAADQRNRVALPSGSRRAPFRSVRHRAKRASLSLRFIPARRDPDRSWMHQRCKGKWIPPQRRERNSLVEHTFRF